MATNKADAENAVRAYLESLLNPGYVSDEVEKLEKQLENETDVIQIAVLKQAIRDEREGTTLIDGFVKHAKAWADELNIGTKTLDEMGVPTEVLQQAGFDVSVLRRSLSPTTKPKSTRTRVTIEDVERSIKAHKKGNMLSVPDLAEKTGASAATVKKALESLVGDAVKEPIDDPSHSGRGRARKLFERA